VLIYFGEELTRRVAAKLHGALADGGWLLVAPAELSLDVFRRFAVVNLDGAVVYRTPAAPAHRPATPARTPGAPPRPRPPAPSPRESAPEPRPPAPSPPVGERSPSPGVGQPVVHSPRDPSARDRIARDPSARERIARDRSAQERGAPERGDEIKRAVGDWRSGRVEAALRRLEAVAEDDPADGRAALLAARIHLDRLELDRAEAWAEVACARAPLSAPAHYVRGLALQEAGRAEEALAALRRSVFLDPGSVLGQVALADLLARQGEPTRARSALRAAAALLDQVDGAEPVSGDDGPTAARVRDLIAAQLGRLPDGPEAAS
jgi:chemotaxis protein methyltransferase CheR